MNCEYPEVFTNDKFKYEKNQKALAHCDGLMGWALCMSGCKPPENFGKGMVKIGIILGIVATPDNLMNFNKE